MRDYLQKNGYRVVLTREPGGTPAGDRIRKILLDQRSELSPWCELFLYLADRANNIEYVIKPGLKQGVVVISDRYFDSTIAYQGAGRHIPFETLIKIRNLAPFNLMPDITVLIDLPVEVGLSRLKNLDRLEGEAMEFHKRVRGMYLKIAEIEKERFLVIDGTLSVEEIHNKIKERIAALLKVREDT